MDMGMSVGEEVKVEKVAPLGDPIEVTIRNYHLSPRKKEAEGIAVEGVVHEQRQGQIVEGAVYEAVSKGAPIPERSNVCSYVKWDFCRSRTQSYGMGAGPCL